ncbi:MAG: hypothetical protein RLZ98_252 [Pseudomonadota bacterium]|jgi:CDP-glucose 4,6-dehydratase
MVNACFHGFYRGKRVLVTGHTGFKGSWLSEWLIKLGAKVTGVALSPPTNPALFDQLGLATRMDHRVMDIRDAQAIATTIAEIQPEVVLHLAAQPLVRLSYQIPLETYATNVMGTAHILDALRALKKPCAAVMVTTDKCYENHEWLHGYREEDSMGGHDPYSSSKGMAELLIAAYRRSYFSSPDSPVRIASARAGNVIGGGDWAMDRIVPDCMRNLASGEAVPVRNRTATRPWQHVLEPLSGYLWLAAQLADKGAEKAALAGGFNFGPELTSNQTVATFVEEVLRHWPGTWVDRSDPKAPHEAGKLNLSTDKAFHLLDWRPVWNFQTTLQLTTEWYRKVHFKESTPCQLTQEHIARYETNAVSQRLVWSQPLN